MYLNTINPAIGAKKEKIRVGRGIGSGLGKTCGRGHKGQKSRAGGFHKTGFEGGQMPIQRRLPKRGFVNFKNNNYARLRISDLNKLKETDIAISVLKEKNLISNFVNIVKIYNSGQCDKKINVQGLLLTSGAKKAIEMVGGKIL